MGKTKTIKLTDITVDMDIQPRAKGSSPAVVEEYAEAAKVAAEFPPLVVYQDGDTYWLSEGFTRVAAYHKAGIEKAVCEVREGDRRKAIINACGSNTTHGQRRTNADKRRAVELVLKQCPRWSDRAIAETAAVSHTFVAEVRQLATVASSEGNQLSDSDSSTRIGADGKERKLPTKPEEPKEDAAESPPEPEVAMTGEAEPDEPPAVRVEMITADKCIEGLTTAIKALNRIRVYFSELMCSPFGEELRRQLCTARGLPIDRGPVYQSGNDIKETAWGTVHLSMKQYTTADLDRTDELFGEIRGILKRAESRAVEYRTDGGDDPWDLGQELGGEQERIPI